MSAIEDIDYPGLGQIFLSVVWLVLALERVVACGVPQRSVFCRILFLMYITDLSQRIMSEHILRDFCKLHVNAITDRLVRSPLHWKLASGLINSS